MAKWGEIKCPKCAAPPISLWEGMVRQLEESDAREARLEAKLAKAVGALGDIYDGEPEWPDEPEKELEWCRNRAKRAIAELKGQGDE